MLSGNERTVWVRVANGVEALSGLGADVWNEPAAARNALRELFSVLTVTHVEIDLDPVALDVAVDLADQPPRRVVGEIIDPAERREDVGGERTFGVMADQAVATGAELRRGELRIALRDVADVRVELGNLASPRGERERILGRAHSRFPIRP